MRWQAREMTVGEMISGDGAGISSVSEGRKKEVEVLGDP